MNILLTGANGFIGRTLMPELVVAGHEVCGAVRRSNGYVNERVIPDIGRSTDWSAALAGCEAVIHLASRVHVMRETATDALAANREINTAGTLNLARQAAAVGVKRFIFASTIKVNGEGRDKPYSESDRPDPQEAYAISKYEAETGLREIADRTGMSVVILRFPLVYGPGVGANFLKLMETIDRGVPLPLASIMNRRSFIYLGNLVDAVATTLSHSLAANKTYLVSDGSDLSTPDLARMLAAALGRPSRLMPVPAGWLKWTGRLIGKRKEMDRLMGSLAVDSSLIRQELGWLPPYTMTEGIGQTALWYRERMNQRLG